MPQVMLSPKAVNRVTLSLGVALGVVGDAEHPATATDKATAGSHGEATRGRNIRAAAYSKGEVKSKRAALRGSPGRGTCFRVRR